MQIVDVNGNMFGDGTLEVTTLNGKPKVPVINTDITIGTTAITSGTVGRVLFEGTGNVVQESANLFWDNTNGRLGIGTSSPLASVHSAGSVNGAFSSLFQNTSTGIQASSNLFVANNSATIGGISTYSSANNTAYLQNSLVLVSNPTASNIVLATSFDVVSGGTGSIQFRTGGYGSTTERMRIFSTGNIGINTTTDAGYKADINGTMRVVGSMLVQGMTVGLGGGANANSVAIGKEALAFNTTYQNCAVGYRALYNNTGGDNTAVGAFYAMFANTTGGRNTGIGTFALNGNTTGQWNSALGYNTSSGNFDGSVILGYGAGATASNQFVVGSSAVNAGAVTTEVNASTQVWNVIINGVARKILLA